MKKIYLVYVILVLANAAFGQCGTPPCNFIYVTTSGTAGNPGTANCPTTLTHALAIANTTQNIILVQGGSYAISNTLSIPAVAGGVTIDGGYDATWVKNSTVGFTTLNIDPGVSNNGNVGYYIGIEPASGANGFSLKDLTINVQSGGASGTYNNMGLSIYGIYLAGQTGYTISRCVVHTGVASAGNAGVYNSTPGGGYGGGAGSDPYYLSNYNGYTYYYVGQSTWNGGCSACSSGGQSGSSGSQVWGSAAGGSAGSGSCSSGCNIFGCNASGSNGGNAGNGSNGTNAPAYPAPSGPGTSGLSVFYVPVSGNSGYNGDGGGGGGSGGAGSPGTCCTGGCGTGQAFGGGGGNGGAGGAGGQGGYGGGGSFAIYVWGGNGTIVDCSLNAGTAGAGGAGAAGHPGAGGSSGFAGLSHGGNDGGAGGNGGTGGTGGTGGPGQTGYTGVSANVEVLNGATMSGNYGGSNVVPTDGILTANWYSGCTNSEIDLTKSTTDTWQLLNGSVYVNNLTSASSGFTSSSSPAEIYYPAGTPAGTYNLGLGLTTFTDFIKITGSRLVTPVNSIINTIPGPCPSGSITLSASLTLAQQSNIVAYDWAIMNTASPGTTVYTSASAAPGAVNIGGWIPGATYQVRLRLKEQCCGWSIPIWGSFTVLYAPVNAGAITGTSILCPSSTKTYSITAVPNTTGYTWTVSGGTITANSSTTYSANVTSISVIWGASGAGTVSVQPYNGCGYSPSATTLNITIDGVPGISISPTPNTGVICLNSSATLQANATSGSGGNGSFTYLWSTASSNQAISPTPLSTTTYTVTVTEGSSNCSASASQIISVNDPAAVSAGTAQTMCAAAGIVNITGATASNYSSLNWTTSGTGYFTAGNTLNASYTPGALDISNGSVILTLMAYGNLPCGNAIDSKILTITQAATATTGGNLSTCSNSGMVSITGASAANFNSLSWTSSGSGSFINGATLTPGYIPSPTDILAGSVTLTLTAFGNAPCGSTSSGMLLNFVPAPVASAGQDQSTCTNSPVLISGAGASNYSSLNWTSSGTGTFTNANTLTPVYTPSVADSAVTLTLTAFGNGPCASATSTKVLTILPLPNGNISGTTSICQGSSATLAFNFSVGTSPFNVIYTDGTNIYAATTVSNGSQVTVNPLATSTFNFTSITDANGCTQLSGFMGGALITVTLLPVISNVSASPALCNGSSTGSITVTAGSGTPPYTYSIDGGTSFQTGNVFGGLPEGINYNLVVTDNQGCSSPYQFNPVTVTQPNPLLQADSATDASCGNVFDGSIVVTATGGITAYTYSLNGGPSQPGNVFTGLASGIYIVTVEDANGCIDTVHTIVGNSYAVTGGLVNQTDVSCFGGSDGTVSVQLSGGVPPYSYSINGYTFQPASTFTGLSAGNYTVILRDSKGCTAFVPVSISQPGLLSITLDSLQNVLCSGQAQGAIFIHVNGGTGPYSFSWSNSATTQNVTNLSAGTFNVTVIDAKGCNSSSGATILQPLPLFLNIATYHNLSCFNDSSGYIYDNASGGMPSYSYTWSNGAVTQDISGLSQGNYSLTVSDMNGCLQTISQTLNQPLQLGSGINGTNVTCSGASNGNVSLTVTGGTPAYSYFWSNGQTTPNLNNVAGGNYSVVVHDANNCSTVNDFNVTQPQPVAVGINVTNVSCYGGSNGMVALTVTGGSGPITYLWSNGSTTANLTAANSGTYSVSIADANFCSASATANITQPGALMLNATPVNVLCTGGSNGAVYVTVNGGVFPYSYNWSNGSSTQNITGLTSGAYTLTVTDGNACSASASYVVNGATALSDSISASNVSCFGAHDGSVNLNVNGGTAPYSYLWSNFLGSQNINSLGGGLYYVIITDANGCLQRDSALVQEPAQLVINPVLSQVTCFNANNGSIQLLITGGNPAYSYAWNTGQTDSIQTGLAGGVYMITVTDSHACSVGLTINLVNPPAIGDNFVVKNPLCYGDSNGVINLIPSGGEPPFTFLWSNQDTSEHIANLIGATYFVTITDSRGCGMTDSVKVVNPAVFYTSGIIKNVSCFGNLDGAAYVTVYGGTLPYDYYWSTHASTQNLVNVTGGNYYLTITDANGCQVASLYVISEPAPLTLSLTATNVSCFGASTGSVTAVGGGGTIPYSFQWHNAASGSVQTGLPAGLYGLQLVDSNGCNVFDSIQVTQPSQIQISGQVTNVSCFGASTGSISLIATGGTPAYNFAWSNGASTVNLNGVIADTYRVTVTDASSCTVTDSFNIQQGNEMIIGLAANPPVCYSANTGFISAAVSGGVPPYRYMWSTGPADTAMLAFHLNAGNYNVTITDKLGCTTTSGTQLIQPQPLAVTALSSGSRCISTGSGMVIANTSGGTPPYNYILNGASQATNTFAHLLPGNYEILAMDVNGCQGKDSFSVTAHSAISVSLSANDPVLLTGMQTQLVALATSDTNIISYTWSPLAIDSAGVFTYGSCADTLNCSAPYVKPPFTMLFTVTAMNADSCFASDTVTITVNKEQVSFIPSAFTPNNDGLNDRFQFAILGASNIDISIYNRWGELVFHNSNQSNITSGTDGWDGTNNGKQSPLDTYVYKMMVTYFDGTIQNKVGTVTLMR